MKRLFIFLLVLFQFSAAGQENSCIKGNLKYQGIDREYLIHLPAGVNDMGNVPLVLALHGYGGSAESTSKVGLTATADKYGFAVCYPQGYVDGKGENCWNVGYPFQEGLKTDDVGFLCHLKKYLQKKYGLSKENAFFCGMSNGGEMSYLMAYEKPHEFNAIAPIAGLTMQWMIRDLSPKAPVPLMEVHGTADMTSMWNGDPQNEGGWGEYIAVPLAVGVWAAEAGCTHEVTEDLPLVRNKVILHRYVGGVPAWTGGPETQVLLYEIQDGKHSWGLDDMDTCEAIWQFFRMYLK